MSSPTPSAPRYPHIAVRLSGTDGNTFSVIGRVAVALRRGVGKEAADAFTQAAFECGSADEVLRLAMCTVAVR